MIPATQGPASRRPAHVRGRVQSQPVRVGAWVCGRVVCVGFLSTDWWARAPGRMPERERERGNHPRSKATTPSLSLLATQPEKGQPARFSDSCPPPCQAPWASRRPQKEPTCLILRERSRRLRPTLQTSSCTGGSISFKWSVPEACLSSASNLGKLRGTRVAVSGRWRLSSATRSAGKSGSGLELYQRASFGQGFGTASFVMEQPPEQRLRLPHSRAACV